MTTTAPTVSNAGAGPDAASNQAAVNNLQTQINAISSGINSLTVQKVKRGILANSVVSKGALPVMDVPPIQMCLAANAQPSNSGSAPTFAYTGIPNPSSGAAFALANYVWYGFPSSGTNNSRGVLTNFATVFNFANWTDLGYSADFNDGQHLENFIASTSAINALNGTGTASSCAPIVAFITDSPIVGFAALYGNPFTLIVDGQIAQVSPGNSAGLSSASVQTVLINFGSRKPRQIIYYGANNNLLAGIAIDATASLSPLDITTNRFVWAAAGHSWEQSHPTLEAAGSHIEKAMFMLGAYAGTSTYIGGTGYLADNAIVVPVLPGLYSTTRIAQLTCANPDLVFLSGLAFNDVDNSAAWLAAVQTVFNGIRAALPNAILAVMGPWCPISTNATGDTKFTRMNGSLLTLLRAISPPWCYLDNLNGINYNSSGWSANDGLGPWDTGTGCIGTTTGAGNGDFYIRAGQTHPTYSLPTRLNNGSTLTLTGGVAVTLTVLSTTDFPASGRLAVGNVTGTYTGVGATTFTGFTPDFSGSVADTTYVQIISGSAVDYFAYRIAHGIEESVLNL